jgi:Reverse transcriptase (RNA-dependent DNA polymerase)
LDNAKEFTGIKWTEFTKEKGIINEYTAPYSPEQNGTAERYNRTLTGYVRTVIKAKNLPTKLWPYIYESIGYILNRTYNKYIGKTPYEALLGSKPDISNIRVLGSLVYRRLPLRDSKLSPTAEKAILIGFKSINYQLYLPETDDIRTARDITILEDEIYPFKDINSNIEELENFETDSEKEEETSLTNKSITIEVPKIDNLNEYEEYIEEPEPSNASIEEEIEEETTNIPLRRSAREKRPTQRLSQAYLASKAYISLANDNIEPKEDFKEPKSYKEAMESPQKEQWLKAMATELKTLNENKTWTPVKNHPDIRPISTRWVYKIKKNDDKSLTYKARFVARGFEQIQGLNYIENFAAVVKQQAFKAIFAIATIKGYIIHKIDIKSAFTHGNIDKTIYIQPPEGFGPENRVLLLNKALYGLK